MLIEKKIIVIQKLLYSFLSLVCFVFCKKKTKDLYKRTMTET